MYKRVMNVIKRIQNEYRLQTQKNNMKLRRGTNYDKQYSPEIQSLTLQKDICRPCNHGRYDSRTYAKALRFRSQEAVCPQLSAAL